jgi:hypothetical protein
MRSHIVILALIAIAANVFAGDPRDDASPWGIAPGAESMGYFAKINPMLQEAGVRWIRQFPEWQNIQPKQGQWGWNFRFDAVRSPNEFLIKEVRVTKPGQER